MSEWISFDEACREFNLKPSALHQLILARFVRATREREVRKRHVSRDDLVELAEKVPEIFEAADANRSVPGRDATALRNRLLRIAAEKRGLLPLSQQARKLGLTVGALRMAAKRHKVNLVRVGGRLYIVPDERWHEFLDKRSLQVRRLAPKLDVELLARLKFADTTENGVMEDAMDSG